MTVNYIPPGLSRSADAFISQNPAAFTPNVPTPSPVSPGPTESDLQRQADNAASNRAQEQRDWEDKRASAQRAREEQEAIAAVKAIFSTYGLSSLYSKIVKFVQQGYSADTVQLLLRETPEYKQRFPAMEALNAKKRGISEAAYINYEQTAAQLEQQYGLPKDMLMNNVTTLLTNEVAPTELNDRVVLAAANSLQAPEDLKKTLSDYYNIGSGGLTAYFLDPNVAMPLLEKQVATAKIGTEATRQGIGIDVNSAENLQSIGITQQQAQEGFGQVAASTELSAGVGDVVTQKELIAGTLGGNAEAKKKIALAAGSRVARFQAGGQFASNAQGVSGLGSSSTG